MATIKPIESIFIFKLKKNLKERNLSQLKLATMTGIDVSLLSKKINNKDNREFTIEEVKALCKAFDLDDTATYLFIENFNDYMLELKINKFLQNQRLERTYYEKLFERRDFQNKDQYRQLFDFLDTTPLFDLDLSNNGLLPREYLADNREECFFPEPVDYCLRIKLKSEIGFSTVPEMSIVGINTCAGKSNIEKLHFAITTLPEYKETLFYFRTKLDRYNKDYLIAYITVSNERQIKEDYKGGVPIDVIERYSHKDVTKTIYVYPHGRDYKSQEYFFPELEILGYVKGVYKSEFEKFIDSE